MKRISESLAEALSSCPAATQSIELNLQNRQTAIDKFGYGPANPNNDEADNTAFWSTKAEMWKCSVDNVKTMLCGNCGAFDVSDKMRKCMSDGFKQDGVDAMATIEKADLGYCNFLHFKCAGTRTCNAWVVGGAIDNKDLTERYKSLESIIKEIK